MAEEAFDEAHSREGAKHYHLAVLLPAYNERERIGDTLSSYIRCLSETPVWGFGAEDDARKEQYTSGSASFLVVDDGSTDDTADFVRGNSWRQQAAIKETEGCWKVDENVACISLPKNSGKGAAIERGMLELSSNLPANNIADPSSVQSVVLVADADGSGDISCIGPMLQILEQLLVASDTASGDRALVVGYRQYSEAKSPLRSLLSWGFRKCVSLIFLGSDLGVRDTQCGLKLMTASTGEALYKNLNLRRWTQDVEVIHRARLLGVPIGECGVSWVDQPGSKLVTKASDAVIMSAVMLGEIASMRVKYAMGAWRVDAGE
ncbi:hypothetical protein ACHAXT_012030 [Thalassiosira profunda]